MNKFGLTKMNETKRVYQQIADQIREIIEANAITTGSRLPAERELAQQLGISRPSLREALIALEIEGAIEIRSGSGVYVLNTDRRGSPSLGESPVELMHARAVIECAVVAQAAAKITSKILSELEQNVAAMKVEIAENRKPMERDRQFHVTLALASGNSVLADIVAKLFDERHSPISARLQGRTESTATWRMAVEEHEAILATLRTKDPVAAQAAMYNHLTASGRRWLET